MNPKQFLTAAFVLAACVYGGAAMPDSFEDSLLLNGRWAKADSCLCASAPAVSVSFRATAKEVSFDIEGEARFRLDTDGKPGEYFTILGRTVQKVALAKDGREHLYRLVKVSESNPGKICLHGIALGKGGSFGKRPEPSRRRIEFIGDSFTVGYGVEANGPEDGTPFEKTNTAKAYSFLLADGFKADYQINAVSGRGLVRNYANIVPEWTLASLYEYTVPGSIEQEADGADQGPKTAGIRWDFEQFHPQVVVVFVGTWTSCARSIPGSSSCSCPPRRGRTTPLPPWSRKFTRIRWLPAMRTSCIGLCDVTTHILIEKNWVCNLIGEHTIAAD